MNILLGVSGGIAAYKALALVRLWVKAGHQVQVVMTEGAKQFIAPLAFQALSGHQVRDDLFDLEQEDAMGHIEMARWPDVIVLAPASANLLARLRAGMADDLLTTLCLATDKPIMFAPAMNRLMWANLATQDNIKQLSLRGWQMIAPESGAQACGEIGAGRLAEPTNIVAFVASYFEKRNKTTNQAWLGKRVLITAGPTYEDLDPVRFIGNRSSGKMGFAMAKAASEQGAEVTLISGPVNLATPLGVTRIDVRSARDMFEAVKQHYAHMDVVIAAAAVADYRVEHKATHKIKKTAYQDELTLNLVKNPDIIAWVAQQENKPFVVGFAAETEKLIPYAQDKLKRKGLDLICANQVGNGQGFDTDDNCLTLITATDVQTLARSTKYQQAQAVLAFIQQATS
ncbi:bifunctional phosphopantothenoylcysteine decarboxylase/phosphopantothenate--cysteine ligase CoaBC [Thiomicrospira sp. R3]|uniref:bifunctional phosphopantothenoylcysteine decarboxylase/phosphopantothenate--cysteine ligase CoaBC n=1 Tax=Thiomicrospira sp. R3 TaxID=3035472 RepID=UPI00259B5D17|nr:bifunctional phosphopantothenoylcysteine decarboxylase/phosphopantothenate--cysteine ligase CoaBC [Thiomicrospira sp. R3]WFE69248.1 bifunctional phosphopantothenoylcysteine decarboxylase/phosphopantothenate--cysteine ligase CoaBC [Thiomicrospira sp. R3]